MVKNGDVSFVLLKTWHRESKLELLSDRYSTESE